MTTQTIISALETAQTGLQWYRDTFPQAVDGSDAEADEEIQRALELARAIPTGDIVITKNPAGQIVAVTRQDDEGRILKVLSESTALTPEERATAGNGALSLLRAIWNEQDLTRASPETMAWAQRMAASIGALQDALPEPAEMLSDYLGNRRKRYVRIVHDGSSLVVPPEDLVHHVQPGDDYDLKNIYLSQEEFDALPEFDGF